MINPPKVEPFYVEECFGNKGCPNSIKNTKELAEKLKKTLKEEKIDEFILSKVNGKLKMHNSFRVAIANCPNACSQVHIKDFGIIVRAKIGYNEDNCNLCKKCVKICPEKAIKIENEKIKIDEKECLKCGLCAKMCPEKALFIEETGYSILIGGKLGRHPSLAVEIENFIQNDENVIDIFKKVLYFYKQNNISGERLGTILSKTDLNYMKQILKGG